MCSCVESNGERDWCVCVCVGWCFGWFGGVETFTNVL
jgi:hypothetical protein